MTISKQQRKAIRLLRLFGRLERYPGGFWGEPSLAECPQEYVGTPTIQALYNRRWVNVMMHSGSWNWDHRGLPRYAIPTQKLMSLGGIAYDVA